MILTIGLVVSNIFLHHWCNQRASHMGTLGVNVVLGTVGHMDVQMEQTWIHIFSHI